MTTEFTPFFQNTFPLEVLKERAGILDSLVGYVTTGWVDPYTRRAAADANTFWESVRASVFTHFALYEEIPKRLRARMRAPGDTPDRLVAIFTEAKRFYGVKLLATPPFASDDLAQYFSKQLGTETISAYAEAKPTVEGAFKMARDNFIQAGTRTVSLYAICSLVKRAKYYDVSLSGQGALREHLYQQRVMFMRDMLVFGGLLGGESQREAVRMAAQQMCHKEDAGDIQYSIMQFLQPGGSIPGSYPAKSAEDFAADIKARYDSL
jgi:hypothetical protein